jgi:hypothetical protein
MSRRRVAADPLISPGPGRTLRMPEPATPQPAPLHQEIHMAKPGDNGETAEQEPPCDSAADIFGEPGCSVHQVPVVPVCGGALWRCGDDWVDPPAR